MHADSVTIFNTGGSALYLHIPSMHSYHTHRTKEDKKPIEYIGYIHKDYLSKISDESGLEYIGGPEVTCTCTCTMVIACVKYNDDRIHENVNCQTCRTPHEAHTLLVSAYSLRY